MQCQKQTNNSKIVFKISLNNDIFVVDLITSVETACHKLDKTSANQVRAECVKVIGSSHPPKSNLTKGERKAMQDLRKDKNITILPADKGRCTVIMNTTDYQQKAKQLVEDDSTYVKLDKNPTKKYKDQLKGIVKKLLDQEDITKAKYYLLCPSTETVPRFYGLPKIHKPSCPLRPIVSSIGSVSYQAARFVADIIAPLVGASSPHHLKNSQDLVNKISDLTLTNEDIMVSYDVTALFTNTPIPEALQVIRDRLTSDATLNDRTTLSVESIMELLTFCVNTTYFMFQGDIYRQVKGAAMGSPVSPLVANIYMEWFEQYALSTFPCPPSLWTRYVDDSFVVIKRDQVEDFTTHLNSITTSIKFTMEREENGQLPMLDTMIHRTDNGKLKVTIFRKPTHTDQYLSMDSHHPLQHKLGVIRTLEYRAKTLVTDPEDKTAELETIRRVLGHCGYKRSHFAIANASKTTSRDQNSGNACVGSVTIPYTRGVSEGLRRIISKRGIQVHFKPRNTLREQLVSPKDKIKKEERCHTVYEHTCKTCNASYIGETKRPLGVRSSEHKREPSPVAMHARDTGHNFPVDQAQILDQDESWFGRGVREACHIRIRGSSLNRDGGRYHLPAMYNSILSRQSPSARDSESHNSAPSC